MKGAKKNLMKAERIVKKVRKPGQVVGVGEPGSTTYTGKPGINKGKKA